MHFSKAGRSTHTLHCCQHAILQFLGPLPLGVQPVWQQGISHLHSSCEVGCFRPAAPVLILIFLPMFILLLRLLLRCCCLLLEQQQLLLLLADRRVHLPHCYSGLGCILCLQLP